MDGTSFCGSTEALTELTFEDVEGNNLGYSNKLFTWDGEEVIINPKISVEEGLHEFYVKVSLPS